MTLPSPLMMQTFWSPEHSTAAYGDPFEMFADAAAIVRGQQERKLRLVVEVAERAWAG